MIAPAYPIPVGHTGAETTLIESVGVLVGVVCCLNIAGAHDYLHKDFNDGCGSHCARKPSCPVFVSGRRKLGCVAVGGAMTEQ